VPAALDIHTPQGALGSRQQQLLQGFSSLEQQHAAQAARASEALAQLAAGAAALEARQAAYEALQVRVARRGQGAGLLLGSAGSLRYAS
jgi:hypothetical protein